MSSGRLLTLKPGYPLTMEPPVHPSTLEPPVHPVTLKPSHLLVLEPGHPLTLVCWLELLWLCLCWCLLPAVLGLFLSCGGITILPLTTWIYCHTNTPVPLKCMLNFSEGSSGTVRGTPIYGFASNAGKAERVWRSLQWSWLTWRTAKRNWIQLQVLTTSATREFLVS